MSDEQLSEGLQPHDQARSDEAALKAAEFLLATRQQEEAQERAAQARHTAQAVPGEEHGKELLAEMIELQHHAAEGPQSSR